MLLDGALVIKSSQYFVWTLAQLLAVDLQLTVEDLLWYLPSKDWDLVLATDQEEVAFEFMTEVLKSKAEILHLASLQIHPLNVEE